MRAIRKFLSKLNLRFDRREGKMVRKSVKNPLQVIAVGFSIIIFIGTILLMLPISSASGHWTDPVTALFTATTSTCVTGLVVVDTYTYWSSFGHIIILLMIQIGGMGFMLMLTAFSILLGRRITIRERLLISKSISLDNMSGVVKLARRILQTTLLIEGLGAVILSVRFIRDFGVSEGIRKGIFHSVSAFCNAGIDLMGQVGEFSGLTTYKGDFAVTFTISFLIILGGLGFYVWDDLLSDKHGRKMSLHTKIVLTTTGVLLALGTVVFFLAEFNNPATIANDNIFSKAMSAFFQSVTCRTAGFNQIDQGALTPISNAFTLILMFIGGSPGSTAGGIKTVTIAVLIMTAIATLKGRNTITVYGRRLSHRHIMDAITITFVGIFSVALGTLAILVFDSHVGFSQAFFECVSAFATVGLTTGITPGLSVASQLALICLMYMGRVGIITLSVAIIVRGKKESVVKYPEGKIIVG